MKTSLKTLAVTTAFLTGASVFLNTAAAAPTEIIFTNSTVLSNSFPTQVASGMYSNPVITTNIHGQDVVELLTGDLTLLNTNRKGQLAIYSTNTYSSSLDFINPSGGLSLVVSNARLDTPRGTTWGKIGITSDNTGFMDGANGIYLYFDRANIASNNSVRLMQASGGVETTLATLISGNVNGMFDAQTFSLSVTASNWSVSLISQNNSGTAVATNTASGDFDTVWTTNAWGANTFLGIEANQNNTTADGNTRYAQFTVNGIQFEQIPEPGSVALLLCASGLILAGTRYRRTKAGQS